MPRDFSQACGPRPRESRAGATQRLGCRAEHPEHPCVRAGDVLGAPVFLAVCTEPITQCRASRRPITAVQAIHVDRGEKAVPGFTPITSTVSGHEANLNYGGAGRDIQLCVARAADQVPLCRLEVLVRSRGGLRVPQGCLLMRGDDGKPRNLNAGSLGSTIFLAFERARPTALLQTPLKPSVLDVLAAADRPRPTEPRERPNNAQRSSTPGEGSDESIALAMAMASRAHPLSGDGDEDGAGDGESMPPLTGAAAAAAALPHAIAHFCFPQGALLRDECR